MINKKIEQLLDSMSYCTTDKIKTLEEICFLQQEKLDMLEKSIDNINANFDKALEHMFDTDGRVKRILKAIDSDSHY